MKDITYKNFTTTLPVNVLNDLSIVAKEIGASRNDIIVEAFNKWNKYRLQAKLFNSYQKASKDKEWKDLGNIGLDDWDKEIQKWG